ncbi:carbohydrate kinase family protein [Candidatus Woesearchaeota archaeon]|nr:carbohydrate kinase family protein [Candidatus Woesearchaeota archaeon]
MYDIITVGSSTVDCFAHTDKSSVKGKYYSFPVGAKLLIEDLNFDTGGGGTNTAVAFSRLGLRTAYLGKMGKGTNSERITYMLRKEKVDDSLVSNKDARTGFSVVLDAEKRDRTILVYKGSNDDLREDDVKWSKLKTKWFYFSSMMKKSLDTQKKIAEFAADREINIAYNPSSYLIKKGVRKIKKILAKTNVLVLNKEEAQMLSKKENIIEVLQRLKDMGPEIVAVTDGAKSVFCSDGKNAYMANPHKVRIKETTGAGDAFAASFVAALIKKKDIEFALRLGIINAESVITHLGAKNNLLRWKDAKKEVQKRKIKIVKKEL